MKIDRFVVRTGPEPEPDRGEPFAMVRFEVQAARQNQTTVRSWVHISLSKNRMEPDHGSTKSCRYIAYIRARFNPI